jgi:HEAT repeat protein
MGDPWSEPVRRGYCYHSALLHYKTETLLRKLREGAPPNALLTIAYELSFRDAELALAEVRRLALDPAYARRKKTLRLCLHHVADAETARVLFREEGFEPDALHLSAFAALLGDYLERLPDLDTAVAEAELRKLGFLAGPVPNPIIDGPKDSSAATTSAARYEALLVQFLKSLFASPSLAGVRAELAEHLRRTLKQEAYVFLVERWALGEIAAVEAVAAVARVGHARLSASVGVERVNRLIHAFAEELAAAAVSQFERSAIINGWLPRSAENLPSELARVVALGFLDSTRLEDLWPAAVEVLLAAVDEGPQLVLERAAAIALHSVTAAARRLPYEEACARLGSEHPALIDHPGAPVDRTVVSKAYELIAVDPGTATERLAKVAGDTRNPHAEEAFTVLLKLAAAPYDVRVRRHAIYRLGLLGDARAEPVVRPALEDPMMVDARILVETALGSLGR